MRRRRPARAARTGACRAAAAPRRSSPSRRFGGEPRGVDGPVVLAAAERLRQDLASTDRSGCRVVEPDLPEQQRGIDIRPHEGVVVEPPGSARAVTASNSRFARSIALRVGGRARGRNAGAGVEMRDGVVERGHGSGRAANSFAMKPRDWPGLHRRSPPRRRPRRRRASRRAVSDVDAARVDARSRPGASGSASSTAGFASIHASVAARGRSARDRAARPGAGRESPPRADRRRRPTPSRCSRHSRGLSGSGSASPLSPAVSSAVTMARPARASIRRRAPSGDAKDILTMSSGSVEGSTR